MAINEILQFGADGTEGAQDIMSQAEYETAADRSKGNQPGIAKRELVNKALRQLSLVCAGLCDMLAEYYENGILDNGDKTQIKNALDATIRAVALTESATDDRPGSLVARDSQGNFAANTMTATLNGAAPKRANARTIAINNAVTALGVAFDGSENITLDASSLNASYLNTGTVPAARLPIATATSNGAMSAADKVKLDNIPEKPDIILDCNMGFASPGDIMIDTGKYGIFSSINGQYLEVSLSGNHTIKKIDTSLNNFIFIDNKRIRIGSIDSSKHAFYIHIWVK